MNPYLTIAGTKIPVIGFGTWNILGKSCTESVRSAIELGYRHIDTAQMYNNEMNVGIGVKESGVNREELFITTKIASSNLHPSLIERSTLGSLKELDSGYIDLLLIHWPTPDMDLEKCLEAMLRLKEKGFVKHVGVSNFVPELFQKALTVGPVLCNQLMFTPYHHEFENLKIAKAHNVIITAYSPLGRGRLVNDAELSDIGAKYNKTASQVALRWLIQLGNVSVIPKAANERHRKENIDIFDFELQQEESDRIAALTHA